MSDNSTSLPSNSPFLTSFYEALFHPVQLFSHLADETRKPVQSELFYGCILVLTVSAMAPILGFDRTHGAELTDLLYQIPLHALLGLLIWSLMSALIGLLAFAFTGVSRFKTLLCLTAYATAPWVLLGPIQLIKTEVALAGPALGALAGLGVWAWSSFLFAAAIGITYKLPFERILILLLLPFCFAAVCLAWLFGFIVNIQHLLPQS